MITAILALLGSILPKILEGIVEDKLQRDAIIAALIPAIMQEANNQNLLTQTDTKVFDPTTSRMSWLFLNGWRPCASWLIVFGWLYAVILAPALGLPAIDPSVVTSMLMGLLGLGAIHAFEAINK